MFDILFARTFVIVGGMLCLTAVTAKINRFFETAYEMWSTIIITFLLLFLIMGFSDHYPANIALVAAFSLAVGWMIGPAIECYGMRYKLRRYLKDKGEPLKKGVDATPAQITDFNNSFDMDAYHRDWQNILFQAIFGTALAVIMTASVVFYTGIDFSFLGGFLFISLSILIIMGLINLIFFRSRLFSFISSYFGAVIFTLYLLYDFSQLKKHAGDESWSTAIDISVSIYLDIINLFLDLLEILAEAD